MLPVSVCLTLLLSAPSADRMKLAVLDIVDKGGGAELSGNLTDVLTVALTDLGAFDVLSRADIAQMLAFEQEKQLFGCESDTSCLAEIGGALGVALLVTGSIGKVGSAYIVSLVLTDTRSLKVLAREQREVADAGQLPSETKGAARLLVRTLLESAQGFLILKASESGADVEVDGRLVGVTPLARQSIPSGPHKVRVTKTGFISWAKDIDVQKDQPSLVEASLFPSLEFIDAYESRARTWRLLAYSSAALGAIAGGLGAYGYFAYNARRATDYNARLAAAGCDASSLDLPTIDCAKSFGDERASIQRFDTFASAAGIGGVALLGLATYFFLQGPTPGIYDQYKPATSVSAMVLPSDGGAEVAALVRW